MILAFYLFDDLSPIDSQKEENFIILDFLFN